MRKSWSTVSNSPGALCRISCSVAGLIPGERTSATPRSVLQVSDRHLRRYPIHSACAKCSELGAQIRGWCTFSRLRLTGEFASVSEYAGVVWSGARFCGCSFSRVHRPMLLKVDLHTFFSRFQIQSDVVGRKTWLSHRHFLPHARSRFKLHAVRYLVTPKMVLSHTIYGKTGCTQSEFEVQYTCFLRYPGTSKMVLSQN